MKELKEEIELYEVSNRQMWDVELSLLNELDKVCEAFSLRYWACAGTLLGAIRHSGFIPWDNDLDIMMPRYDYEKLCGIASDVFKHPIFFQTEHTDPGCIRGHAQLRNSDTTAIQIDDFKKGFLFNQGIFIDIFPLDNIPDDIDEKKRFRERINALRKRSYTYRDIICTRTFENSPKGKIKLILSAAHKLFKKKYSNKWYTQYEKEMKRYEAEDTKKFALLALDSERFEWEKKDFEKTVIKRFENRSIPVPSGYLNILRKCYGDWETPVKDAACHGELIVDLEKGYIEYVSNE